MDELPGGGADRWNEYFPDAIARVQAHDMPSPIPLVEVADDAYSRRVWRPDREARAGNAQKLRGVRAEFLVDVAIGPLAKQVEVHFAQ